MNIPSYMSPCEKHRKLLVLLVIVLLISTLYTSQSVAAQDHVPQNKDLSDDTSCYDGYVIKFKEEPLSIFKHRFKERMKNIYSYLTEEVTDKLLAQKVLQHKNKILSLHRQAKEDILEIVGNGSKNIFSREFIVLFNGITIKNVPDETLEKIRDLPYVSDVYPNYECRIFLDESIPIINADDVWYLNDPYGRSVTGKGVTIAILDTGVDYNHPDLRDNFVGGYDFVNNDSDPMDDQGHGTHCAGIAVGRGNESGYTYVGVAPDAKFYAYKVLDEGGYGNFSLFLAGMESAVDPNGDGDDSDHVDIISFSAGDSNGNPDDLFSKAADNVSDLGILVVAAAGNDGPSEDTIASPGCAWSVLCVGATDKNDVIYYKSSRGASGTFKPNVVAPGVNIMSAKWNGGYTSKTGTSMATPHVAGAAALLMQMHPTWTSDAVKVALESTAVDIGYECNTQGHGRIDVLKAVGADQKLIIKSPGVVNEGSRFTVSIVDMNGTSVRACILFTTPFHLPRFRYGSSVCFRAPLILNRRIGGLYSKIIVFKIFEGYKVSKDITVVNK